MWITASVPPAAACCVRTSALNHVYRLCSTSRSLPTTMFDHRVVFAPVNEHNSSDILAGVPQQKRGLP